MGDFHDLRRRVDWTWFGPSKLTPWGSPLESDLPIEVFANNNETTYRIGKLYMDDFHDLRRQIDWT